MPAKRSSHTFVYLNPQDDSDRLFVQRIRELHGTVGQEWLDRLPDLLTECERRWSLTLESPFTPLSYNYVAPARGEDGRYFVVKVGVPRRELFMEIEALRAFNGNGAIQLIDSDSSLGILLLERAEPGTLLSQLKDDEEAVSIAASVIRELSQAKPYNLPLPTLDQWFDSLRRLRQTFGGTTGPLPRELVERAEKLVSELYDPTHGVLLHADLHSDNIVAAQRRPWLAIDPHGVLGDPAYEVAAWLHTIPPRSLSDRPAGEIFRRRMDQFADELQLDRQRIQAWGLANAVLSACWSIEDHGYGWEEAIFCAQTLYTV